MSGANYEHDPLCPHPRMFAYNCVNCDLIARVAERERERAAARVRVLWPEIITSDMGVGYRTAINTAVAAARGGEA